MGTREAGEFGKKATKMIELTNLITATEAACEFIPPGAEIKLADIVDGITLSRKPEVGDEFYHRDFSTGKKRVKPLQLCIHKVYDGKIVAHQVGHKPDADGHYAQIYCFPLGIREEDVKWL